MLALPQKARYHRPLLPRLPQRLQSGMAQAPCHGETIRLGAHEVDMSVWVYLFGELPGASEQLSIKVGRTNDLQARVKNVNQAQMTNSTYILLAGVVGTPKDEAFIKNYFCEFRRDDKGPRQEYFYADSPIVEYAAWLRGQWWAATEGTEQIIQHPCQDSSLWLPQPERRYSKPSDDPTVLIQSHATQRGCLPEPYSWLPNPRASFQDYFTPVEIIDCARMAMDGIDLDAASHWAANKVFKIPDYFDSNRSAFVNDWYGSVWLNPPYGNNKPWFDRALHFINTGAIQQMCMISPVWSFTTQAAKEFMSRMSAMVLLSPTPDFWGNADPRKIGSNHPHAVVYFGDNPDRFLSAFASCGIPMKLGD